MLDESAMDSAVDPFARPWGFLRDVINSADDYFTVRLAL
jgi:hypothetical protein